MRFLNMLSGALLGAVPGLLLMAVGYILTDGGDGMIPFGLGGVALILVGIVVGAGEGWTRDDWLNGHGVLGAIVGLATVLLLGGWLVVVGGGPPDPILDARDCLEIYELHGATGPQGELLTFPDLSDEEIEAVRVKIEEFGEEDASDPVCVRLNEEMDLQASR